MAQNAIEEIFTILPYESAIAMRRGMEFGICSSVLLLCHCAYLVAAYWDSSSPADSFLRALSVGRLMCAIPRFRFWFETHQQFVRARLAATPQLATQQMIWIYANPSRLERVLLFTYYIWLLLVSVLVGLGMHPCRYVHACICLHMHAGMCAGSQRANQAEMHANEKNGMQTRVHASCMQAGIHHMPTDMCMHVQTGTGL